MTFRPHRVAMRVLSPIALAIGLLAGCSPPTEQDLLAKARAQLDKKEYQAAILELKAALEKRPAQSEARLLLGTTLLSLGDRVAAEVELRKAAEAPELADRVVPVLAQTMLALGQAPKVIQEFGNRTLTQPSAQASLLTTLAAAYAATGQSTQSQRALAAALDADAHHAPALIFGARQRANAGDIDGALAVADAILARDPNSAGAWNLKGDLLLFGKRKPAEAETAYRSALKSDPALLEARFSLVAVLEQAAKLDAAAAEIAYLKKTAPLDPQTRFLEAQHAFYKDDMRAAREMTQVLLRVAPKNPNVLQMAGAIEHRLGAWTQAEIYLSRALLAAPDLVMARRLLISTYQRTGQFKKALAALDTAFARGQEDAGLYPIAGEVYLQNGDTARAEKYFVKALEDDPQNASRRAALAMLRVSSGRTAEGLAELENLAANDKSTLADQALISIYLKQNDLGKSLLWIDKLEAKQPDKPMAANLRGRVLLAKKDLAAARKSFERALEIDPGFFPSAAALAQLDLADKQPEVAKGRFQRLLERNPKSVQALVALAQLAEGSATDKEQAVSLLTKATEVDPADPGPRQLLVDALLRRYNMKQALVVAQNGVSLAPGSPENLYLLGRVQQMSGDLNQALSTYSRLIAMNPSVRGPYLRLAETHIANNNSDAARASLRKAMEANPDYVEAQRALTALDLGARRFNEARKTALGVQAQRPTSPDGYILEGDVANAQKDWAAAAVAYRAALQRGPVPSAATKLHAVLTAGGKAAEAEAFVAAWLKRQPGDTVLLTYLGEQALRLKDLPAAERHYLAVLQRNPNHVLALNNLAWVTSQLGKPGALDYAERANKLAPEQSDVLDTLANLLADAKSYPRAIDLQLKAVSLQPSNSGLRLGLAKIYIKSGDKEKARAELETLEKLGDKFSAQSEVALLLRTL